MAIPNNSVTRAQLAIIITLIFIIWPRLLTPTVGVDNCHRMAIATDSLSMNRRLPPQASPSHKEAGLACTTPLPRSRTNNSDCGM
jgi:hypothetical protein